MLSGGEAADSKANLIILDQTLIVFDVEQPKNASQVISIHRHPEADGPVAWRFQTNAPTRYMVCPNGGMLQDERPVTVVIELVQNKYNPNHQMIVQAVALKNPLEWPTAWNDEDRDPATIQAIELELGTTLINLEKATALGELSASAASASITNLLEQSQTTGADRVKELEELHTLLQDDVTQLKHNCTETIRLKEVLIKQVEQKRQMVREMQNRLAEEEKTNKTLRDKLAADEKEVFQARAQRAQRGQAQPCTIS